MFRHSNLILKASLRLVKKSFERDTFTAKNAKYTLLSALLDNDSESANESSSSTSFEEYNELISQM